MSAKLIPCGDRILIEKIPTEKKQTKTCSSGLVLPNKTKSDGLILGKVIAVGPGIPTPEGGIIPVGFCEGDVVLFSKHMSDEYTHEGKDYYIAKGIEIMLKIEGYSDSLSKEGS